MQINRLVKGLYKVAVLLSLLVIMASLLQACSMGFKPRGADSLARLPLQDLSVYINGELAPVFAAELRGGLMKSGATLVDEAAPGIVVLDITKLREDKTVSAYSSIRQVREFNHFTRLSFKARRQQASKEGAKPKQISATVQAEQLQIYDSEYILGVAEEERIIRKELRAEAIHLLALRLGALR